jgi:hypothetical protein
MISIHNAIASPSPPYRRLRAFSFDPILSRQMDTYEINEVTLKIPWDEKMEMGPVDSYLEVVDYDPSSKAFYAPVDLNDPKLLAQDGLPPSEGNPQFHQQMAYAVARKTIDHFELALGRRVLWSNRLTKEDGEYKDEFMEHLRIYPHALREANAYYSPEKKALLFGYFPSSSKQPGQNMPGETVFTCLSHDIVAHETTHAIIDGLHPRFIEPSNMDVWALHEALADIVALFQHFTYAEVLKHQISRTRGNLESQNLLGELAFQFGQATELYGALRNAIGKIDKDTKKWIPKEPDPTEILRTIEPHDRGAILVSAIFDAFLTIYKSRIRDLLRIASGGTGVLAPGEISPDLVERLAQEASKTSGHLLHICIRALDYLAPVDNDFGDYLRALITADVDVVKDDTYNYRLAIIEAFRRRGIYPSNTRNLSVESLRWYIPTKEEQEEFQKVFRKPANLRRLVPEWGSGSNREDMYAQAMKSRRKLYDLFVDPRASEAAKAAHINLKKGKDSIYRNEKGIPFLEVHSVRPARRNTPEGRTVTELVIEMTQRRRGYINPEIQNQVDRAEIEPPKPDFIFRGGCTLLVDPRTAEVRYCIYKDVTSQNRLNRMREFLMGEAGSTLRATYFGNPHQTYFNQLIRRDQRPDQGLEPFALLHRSAVVEEFI